MTRLSVIAAALLAFSQPAAAQDRTDPMAATVAQWFTMVEQQFVRLADAMPADRYGFAPKDGEFKNVRTFAEQVKHVACANFGFFNEVEHKAPPPNCETGGPSPAKTKTELVQYLRESFAYAGQVMRRLTPANALDPVEGPYGGKRRGSAFRRWRCGMPRITMGNSSSIFG